jgi:hypothetical protein
MAMLKDDYADKLGSYLSSLPDGMRLLGDFGKGLSAERQGNYQNAAQYFLTLGVDLFHRGDNIDLTAAERFIRMSAELAKRWDSKVPIYLYPMLEGNNALLGDANGWLGHAVVRRGRYAILCIRGFTLKKIKCDSIMLCLIGARCLQRSGLVHSGNS